MKRALVKAGNNLRYTLRLVGERAGLPGFQVHGIRLRDPRLVYIPIPKNACSSLKHALYEIEFGTRFDYDLHRQWGYVDIHDYYRKRNRAFTSPRALMAMGDAFRFAIVRDPVQRLISCYGNRVVDLGDLKKTKAALEKAGLPLEPDLNTFVLKLTQYRRANKSIRHHSELQVNLFGKRLDYLDEVYPIERMDSIKEMLRQYKPDLELRREKASGAKFHIKDLSREALEYALDFYEQDYSLLRGFYTPESVIERYDKDAPK